MLKLIYFLLFQTMNAIKLTSKQIKYKEHILDNDISCVVCSGPAGSGKTSIGTEHAVELLCNNNFDQLVITKPLLTVESEEIGFLPGGMNEKISPFSSSITQYIQKHDCCKEKIRFIALGFMRGMSFKNTIIIADEMQNSTPMQMKMLLTRLGENSKIIITGDLEQSDHKENRNGLIDLRRKLYLTYSAYYWKMFKDGIAIVEFDKDDVKRSNFVKKILEIYE